MRSEFEFIHNLKKRHTLNAIGDDCAVLPLDTEYDLLVTSDMLVQDVDFRLLWATPEQIGYKTLAVSLSDIAAMGGEPTWALTSLAVPDELWKSDFVDRLYEGWFELAREWNVELVGGDISKTNGGLTIDCTVAGRVEKGKAFLRSNARPGDAIILTGSLGGAAGGLRLLENGEQNDNDLTQKQLHPVPQLAIAKLLQDLEIVGSMIDVSDGLSSDLRHICVASGVGAILEFESIPINPSLYAHFPADECSNMALNGGEDFELLFTVPEKNISKLDSTQFTQIGTMTANVGMIELSLDGVKQELTPKGYRHF